MSMQHEAMSGPEAGNRWQDWVNLILAVWLFLSPWVLQFSTTNVPAAGDAWVFAVVIGGLSIAALVHNRRWEEWINLLCGAWIAVSPWALGLGNASAIVWNFLIVGVLVFAVAIWDLVRVAPTHAAIGQH